MFTGSRGFVWGQILQSLPSKGGKNTHTGGTASKDAALRPPSPAGCSPRLAEQTAEMGNWLKAVQFHLHTLLQMLCTTHPACLEWGETCLLSRIIAELKFQHCCSPFLYFKSFGTSTASGKHMSKGHFGTNIRYYL